MQIDGAHVCGSDTWDFDTEGIGFQKPSVIEKPKGLNGRLRLVLVG